MRKEFTGVPGKDWELVGGTYSFTGPPDDCTGTLSIVNRSDQRVRIRRLQTSKPARARKGFTALKATDTRLRINLDPQTEANSEARLELPDHMPPGRYLAHLATGNTKVVLEINVEAERVLELDPEEQLLVGHAGETITFPVRVLNAGNTPINLQPIAPVWLLEEDWTEKLLVTSVQKSEEAADFASFAQRLLDRAREQIPAPAQVTASPSPELALEPGHSVDLNITVALPDNLGVGREYNGHLRINEERVDLEVYCNGPATRSHPAAPTAETNE